MQTLGLTLTYPTNSGEQAQRTVAPAPPEILLTINPGHQRFTGALQRAALHFILSPGLYIAVRSFLSVSRDTFNELHTIYPTSHLTFLLRNYSCNCRLSSAAQPKKKI